MTTKTYLIRWTSAYSTYDNDCSSVYDAENIEKALDRAYRHYMKEAGRLGHGSYAAELATRENLEEAGFDPDEYLIEEDE